MKYILSFCSLFLVSNSFANRTFSPEDTSNGTFEVSSIEKPNLDCKKLGIEGGLENPPGPPGCIPTLKKTSKVKKGESPLKEFRALGGEGSCDLKKGAAIKGAVSRNCCYGLNFTGCSKHPEEHSTGMWAVIFDVWYVVDTENIEKFRSDFSDTITEHEWDRPAPSPPQSVFSKIRDWIIELF